MPIKDVFETRIDKDTKALAIVLQFEENGDLMATYCKQNDQALKGDKLSQLQSRVFLPYDHKEGDKDILDFQIVYQVTSGLCYMHMN